MNESSIRTSEPDMASLQRECCLSLLRWLSIGLMTDPLALSDIMAQTVAALDSQQRFQTLMKLMIELLLDHTQTGLSFSHTLFCSLFSSQVKLEEEDKLEIAFRSHTLASAFKELPSLYSFFLSQPTHAALDTNKKALLKLMEMVVTHGEEGASLSLSQSRFFLDLLFSEIDLASPLIPHLVLHLSQIFQVFSSSL